MFKALRVNWEKEERKYLIRVVLDLQPFVQWPFEATMLKKWIYGHCSIPVSTWSKIGSWQPTCTSMCRTIPTLSTCLSLPPPQLHLCPLAAMHPTLQGGKQVLWKLQLPQSRPSPNILYRTLRPLTPALHCPTSTSPFCWWGMSGLDAG